MVSPDAMDLYKLEEKIVILRISLADELSGVSDLRLEAMDLDQDVFEKSRQLQHERRDQREIPNSLASLTEKFFDLQEELIEMECETKVMREQTKLLKSRSTRIQQYLRDKVCPTRKREALERERSFKTAGDISLKSLQSAPGRMILLGPAAA
jgi:chromosome segregation ATPase